jgi:hypothetical protein
LKNSGASQIKFEEFIVVNFNVPVQGVDPLDNSTFTSDRHKIQADWCRQDGRETLFILDGEIVSSWHTELIAKIIWPSGADIPVTPIEFASRMAEIKAEFPKAWSKWTESDEKLLIGLFQVGEKVSSIAKKLDRAPGGVYSRLRKLNLIDEFTKYSEDLVKSPSVAFPSLHGTVYGLIKDLYQVELTYATSEKVDKRFKQDGWFLGSLELFECSVCKESQVVVLRKHWKNWGKVLHRWSITCLKCRTTGESQNFDNTFISTLKSKLDALTPISEICPDCKKSKL